MCSIFYSSLPSTPRPASRAAIMRLPPLARGSARIRCALDVHTLDGTMGGGTATGHRRREQLRMRRVCRSPSPTGDGTMTSMPQRSHDGQPAGAAHPPCLHENATDWVRASVDAIYRSDARRVLATLIRLLGDIERAEEALH